jgi:hypothetical protein
MVSNRWCMTGKYFGSVLMAPAHPPLSAVSMTLMAMVMRGQQRWQILAPSQQLRTSL